MKEARRVLERLERIEALERALYAEVASLAPEAEAWARREHDESARQAARRLADALDVDLDAARTRLAG